MKFKVKLNLTLQTALCKSVLQQSSVFLLLKLYYLQFLGLLGSKVHYNTKMETPV